MSTLSAQDAVIATIVLGREGRIIKKLPGHRVNDALFEDGFVAHITEKDLMEMNGFVRAKWEAIATDLRKPL